MGLPDSNGADVGAILEGVEAKWCMCSFRPGNVHRPIDDVSTKELALQLDLGQVQGFWFFEFKKDAIETARGHLRVLPFLANLQCPVGGLEWKGGISSTREGKAQGDEQMLWKHEPAPDMWR